MAEIITIDDDSDSDVSKDAPAAATACSFAGLTNYGNTCFANASLQILRLLVVFKNVPVLDGQMREAFVKLYTPGVFHTLLSFGPAYFHSGGFQQDLPVDLKRTLTCSADHAVCRLPSSQQRQADAREYLRAAYDTLFGIAEQMTIPLDAEYDVSTEVAAKLGKYNGPFYNDKLTQAYCVKCSWRKLYIEPQVNEVSVKIGTEPKTINDLILDMFQPWPVTDFKHENAGFGCIVFHQLLPVQPSAILSVCVDRFRFPKSAHQGEKIMTDVLDTLTLDLPCGRNHANPLDAVYKVRYRLIGSITHHGSTLRSGHYTATVSCGQKWYLCNDAIITEINNTSDVHQQAYMLFYERADDATNVAQLYNLPYYMHFRGELPTYDPEHEEEEDNKNMDITRTFATAMQEAIAREYKEGKAALQALCEEATADYPDAIVHDMMQNVLFVPPLNHFLSLPETACVEPETRDEDAIRSVLFRKFAICSKEADDE